ncbi:MAG: hypothetical protein HQL17_08650 [Candidatus Omnitrophica bacterium]|nr:hypothetical protein [Candidatus Omnitrophota bacterium]
MNNIFKTLYGISPKDIQQTVVIMPFDIPKVAGQLGILHMTNGKLFACGQGHGFTLIRSGMSAGFVGDCVLRLKDTPCTKIIFLGTCGLIERKPGLDIGSVVTPGPVHAFESFSEIITGNLKTPTTVHTDMSFVKGKVPIAGCISFASIHEESKHTHTFRQLGADVVEMECAAFFLAAKHIGRISSALLIISDIIGDENICFKLSDDNKKSLANGVSQACKTIKDICKR